MTQTSILDEIAAERVFQDVKWGEQSHRDVIEASPLHAARYYGIPTANSARSGCNWAAAAKCLTWADIAVEELAEAVEAFAQGDTAAGRTELVQTCAVLVAQIEHIDRRNGQPVPTPERVEPF